jgi:hypothetical protein
MDFLFYLLGLPFQAVGSVFQFLLTCFFFIVALVFGIIAFPIVLVWGILKGVFGVLLSVVLFLGSPFGIGAHSEPASSPQVAYQATRNEALVYPEPINSPSTTYRAALNTTVLAPSSPAVNCDPSYPDFCIAPSLPDLNCSDISHKNFTVRQPDPHKFDRDKDGIGCES